MANGEEYVPTWEETRWLDLEKPYYGKLTEAQEAAIMDLIEELGYEKREEWEKFMSEHTWDYYDVLREIYG